MDQDVANTVEQALEQNWRDFSREIGERFPQVPLVDLNSAYSVDDLCARIADKTHYSQAFVEQQIVNIVVRGNGDSLIKSANLGQPGQQRARQTQETHQFAARSGGSRQQERSSSASNT